jgi:hypothetical protein
MNILGEQCILRKLWQRLNLKINREEIKPIRLLRCLPEKEAVEGTEQMKHRIKEAKIGKCQLMILMGSKGQEAGT